MQVSYWNPATCPILNFPPDLHWPDLQKTLPPKNTGWLWPPNAENMSDWAWRLGGVKNEMNVLRPSKDCWCYWFHPKLRIYVLETRKNLDEYRTMQCPSLPSGRERFWAWQTRCCSKMKRRRDEVTSGWYHWWLVCRINYRTWGKILFSNRK